MSASEEQVRKEKYFKTYWDQQPELFRVQNYQKYIDWFALPLAKRTSPLNYWKSYGTFDPWQEAGPGAGPSNAGGVVAVPTGGNLQGRAVAHVQDQEPEGRNVRFDLEAAKWETDAEVDGAVHVPQVAWLLLVPAVSGLTLIALGLAVCLGRPLHVFVPGALLAGLGWLVVVIVKPVLQLAMLRVTSSKLEMSLEASSRPRSRQA